MNQDLLSACLGAIIVAFVILAISLLQLSKDVRVIAKYFENLQDREERRSIK